MEETRDESVSRLLYSSRAAHDRAKMCRLQKNREQARTELETAYQFRCDADTLDPAHLSPLWANESPTHEAMMAFYLKQLGVRAGVA